MLGIGSPHSQDDQSTPSVLPAVQMPLPLHLSSAHTAVREDSLASDPASLSDQKSNKRCNVLNLRQAIADGLAFKECNGFIALLCVKECCSRVSQANLKEFNSKQVPTYEYPSDQAPLR